MNLRLWNVIKNITNTINTVNPDLEKEWIKIDQNNSRHNSNSVNNNSNESSQCRQKQNQCQWKK